MLKNMKAYPCVIVELLWGFNKKCQEQINAFPRTKSPYSGKMDRLRRAPIFDERRTPADAIYQKDQRKDDSLHWYY